MQIKCRLLLFSLSLLTVSVTARNVSQTNRAQSQLKGLYVSILGDSYSTYGGFIPEGNYCWYAIDGIDGKNSGANDVNHVSQTWWHQLCSEQGMTLDTNNSFSGSTICNTGYDGKDVTTTSFIARMKEIGNPNILLIFGATNDSWANSPIGEYKYADWTEADLKSFRPALAYLFDWLLTHKPGMRIYFILNTHMKEEINSSVDTICAHYGIPYVRLENISLQSGHPDQAGMSAIARQVARELEFQYSVF